MEKFTIKPLEWFVASGTHFTETTVGAYTVGPRKSESGSPFFYQHKRNGARPADSIEDGKRQAESHYLERVKSCLVPVENTN
jgi:hypothetical protein